MIIALFCFWILMFIAGCVGIAFLIEALSDD